MIEHASRAGMSVRRLNPKWPNARIHTLKIKNLAALFDMRTQVRFLTPPPNASLKPAYNIPLAAFLFLLIFMSKNIEIHSEISRPYGRI